MSTSELLKEIPGECATPEELGNAGWTVLHSAAAVYPYKPSAAQQKAFHSFLCSWSQVYACSHCAYHMRRYLQHNPPVVTDKLAVNRYICEFHNAVNRTVGKDAYDCDPMKVLRRWHPTFPEMEDQPTIEEQILEQQEKRRRQQQQTQFSSPPEDSRQGVAHGRWREKDGAGAKNSPMGNFLAGWVASSQQKIEKEEEAVVQRTFKEAAAPPGEMKPPQGRWSLFGFGNYGGGADASRDISSGGGAVADDEADVSAVLQRLKACMVYCPEKEKNAPSV